MHAGTSDRAQLHDAGRARARLHGRIDVLVNGAGVNSATPFLDIDDDELERVVAVNQLAVVARLPGVRALLRRAGGRTGEGASIINVGSASGLTPLSRVFTYSMAKAAVHNLTKNLAREWGPLGIRCNVLVPGLLPGGAEPADPHARAGRPRSSATPRWGGSATPTSWSARRCCWPSDAGRFITGAEIVVDGGFGAMTI